MKNVLLTIRDACKNLYADYDIIIRPVLKFGLAMLSFLIINNELGYLSALNNLFVLIILSVICAILPLNGMVWIGTLLIVAHCFGLGLEVGAFATVLYLLMLLLYFRFAAKDALSILLTPVAFVLRVPLAVPLSLGMIRGPVSAISMICGILSWQFIHSVHEIIEPMKNVPDASLLDILQALPRTLLTQEVIFYIIVFTLTFLVVTTMRKMDVSYAAEKTLVAGAIVYLVLMLAGSRILDVSVPILETLLGTVLGLAIAFFLKVFYYSADYKSSELLQFEDDRNYYRVKVIPKLHPVDSRTGEALGPEAEEEVPEADVKRFRKRREEEIEKKFRGVNIQAELEQTLQSYGRIDKKE